MKKLDEVVRRSIVDVLRDAGVDETRVLRLLGALLDDLAVLGEQWIPFL